MKRNVGVSLSSEVLKKVDARRGLVPRSAYIEEILRKHVEQQPDTGAAAILVPRSP